MSAQPLPQLLDARGLQTELGIKRGAADTLMRNVKRTRIGRRVYVDRDDVRLYLERHTESANGRGATA